MAKRKTKARGRSKRFAREVIKGAGLTVEGKKDPFWEKWNKGGEKSRRRGGSEGADNSFEPPNSRNSGTISK